MARRRRLYPEGGGLSQVKPDQIARGYAGERESFPPVDRSEFRVKFPTAWVPSKRKRRRRSR